MSSDLDSIDGKIIQTLQKDSSKSFVEIASKIGLFVNWRNSITYNNSSANATKKGVHINELSCENVYIACEMSSLENQMSLKSDDPNYYAHWYNGFDTNKKKIRILDSTLREGEQH